MSADVHVLTTGYVGDRVASTVTLILDGQTAIIVDPGMVADRARILDPLAQLDVVVDSVTDVIFSHHHPDHTVNAALFPAARIHDFMAIYRDDIWQDRPADGFELSTAVRLMATPGHTHEDITTVAETTAGPVVFTHLWWHSEGPAEDPFSPDPELLHASRTKVLALEPILIVPGHGPPFQPSPRTPR